MAHKTKIGGTNYGISGGKAKIGGTNYGISGGKTKVSGTGYDVKFRGAPTSVWVTGFITGEWTSYPYAFRKITEYSIKGGAFTQITGSGVYATTDIHAGDTVTIKCTLTGYASESSASSSCRIVYNNTEVVASGGAAGTVYTFVAGESITIQGSTSVSDGYAIYITNQ